MIFFILIFICIVFFVISLYSFYYHGQCVRKRFCLCCRLVFVSTVNIWNVRGVCRNGCFVLSVFVSLFSGSWEAYCGWFHLIRCIILNLRSYWELVALLFGRHAPVIRFGFCWWLQMGMWWFSFCVYLFLQIFRFQWLIGIQDRVCYSITFQCGHR